MRPLDSSFLAEEFLVSGIVAAQALGEHYRGRDGMSCLESFGCKPQFVLSPTRVSANNKVYGHEYRRHDIRCPSPTRDVVGSGIAMASYTPFKINLPSCISILAIPITRPDERLASPLRPLLLLTSRAQRP